MIHSMDRSGYFGASDTAKIMAKNHDTMTWKRWWDTKLGAPAEQFSNKYTRAGEVWEHPILKVIHEDMTMDGQIIKEDSLLRVNYDGYMDGTIYEIKTHGADKIFSISGHKDYWMQCQVEMYVYQEMAEQWFLPKFKQLYLVSYALDADDYEADYGEAHVNANKLVYHKIDYDKSWIKGEYLPALKPLVRALKKGKFPG